MVPSHPSLGDVGSDRTTLAAGPGDPVDDDFLDPFDRLVLKGQSIRPVLPPSRVPRVVTVVELADEFGLTTAAALDVCERAGVAVSSGGARLTDDEADRFRATAREPIVADERPSLDRSSLRARLERRGYAVRAERHVTA
jgi:hypothetical protein